MSAAIFFRHIDDALDTIFDIADAGDDVRAFLLDTYNATGDIENVMDMANEEVRWRITSADGGGVRMVVTTEIEDIYRYLEVVCQAHNLELLRHPLA
jgi:phage-related protein